MEHVLSVEELIVNDSFISYCNSKNPEDISFWENYVLQYPAEKKTVDEARAFILALKDMLQNSEKQKALERFRKALNEETSMSGKSELNVVYMAPQVSRRGSRMIRYRWYAAAAAVVVIAVTAWMLTGKTDKAGDSQPNAVANQMLIENSVTKTGGKERKIVFLPDGTKVTMNANTTLTVDSSFGMNTRLVRLEGEAFFDVQHDKRAPFIVQLKDYRVRVLGTMFNVRSYPGDKSSETALVKGKVEIEENVTHHTLSLRPYEKAILPTGGFSVKAKEQVNAPTENRQPVPIVIKPLTISNDGISISETAWMQNRLEINDETFLEIKNKLERWYGVSIRFNNDDVKQYRFTATFEKENIDQALQAMQLSYPFKYTKKDNLLMIEK